MIDTFRLLYTAILDYSIRNNDLNIPCVTHKQFEVLQDVSSILSIAHQVQQLLSAECTPTLAFVLPLYEKLIAIWRTCLKKFPQHSYAISLAINKIEEYIGKTCSSPVHAFAMFINPNIKMNWIYAHWTEAEMEHTLDRIKAQLLVYAEEQHQKKLKKCNQIQSTRASTADRAAMSQQYGYVELLSLSQAIEQAPDHPLSLTMTDSGTGYNAYTQPESDPFDSEHQEPVLSYAALTAQLSPEQLRIVLKTSTNLNNLPKENVNIVDYWKNNGDVLPLIHQMAVDVLPAQASSVSSERVFSLSKLTCTWERNHISSELVEVLQVVKYSVCQQCSSKPSAYLLDFGEHIALLGDNIVE
ncbi:HAT family dimerization protein [Ceratobasidium theobromae]|uniref:HAT family dimerization protein n=1 Tax=Ceratobasidium theobromae TaxID=1582974 RepID=A0A5N5Q7Z8_9AGAM|nr:HAT family dimerization protein [Ceratobasidium theobromae]